jgi:hypothetical protein
VNCRTKGRLFSVAYATIGRINVTWSVYHGGNGVVGSLAAIGVTLRMHHRSNGVLRVLAGVVVSSSCVDY